MESNKIAQLLFPHITKTPEDYEKSYPRRALPSGAKVTRLGPSPTGFIHLGNLYGAFVDERLAHQSGGIFYLRIEDTDEKRTVEGAVDTIINSLDFFGITFDEGTGTDEELGDYGPYCQSRRKEIYQCYIKDLVMKGAAYPCFLTEDQISEMRAQQEKDKATPGIYGKFASCRDLTFQEVEEKITKGENYVIRLRSRAKEGEITVEDGIRGTLTMPANMQDIVIMKATGLPTYHFAHAVDDHLMGTTHVVRGEEWLSSLPVHIELFEVLGFEPPIYCHTAQLMKLDGGNKRKLSKRKDPELSLDYYRQEGYFPEALREYLLTILNSDYEEWRKANPDENWDSFPFKVEKMSNSGALFDLDKLNDISKDVLVTLPASHIREFMKKWASEFRPEIYEHICDPRMESILNLGRSGGKPRKDLIYADQIFNFISYFFDDFLKIEDPYPDNVPVQDVKDILEKYMDTYNHNDDQNNWFDKIRTLSSELGYAAKPKDFKKEPDKYKGHVGHVSTVIRIALTGRSQSPDIWEIQQILGEDITRSRIKNAAGRL